MINRMNYAEKSELLKMKCKNITNSEKQLLQELMESGERFYVLIQAFAQAVWETKADGTVAVDSPTWRNYTGQTVEEWFAYGWLSAVHPDDYELAIRSWQSAEASMQNMNTELRIIGPDGTWKWTNVIISPIRNSSGIIVKWVGMSIDISQRKATEHELRKSEEKYHTLFNSMDEAVNLVELIYDSSGKACDFRILEANQAQYKLHGSACIHGKRIREIVPDVEQSWIDTCSRVALTGESARLECRVSAVNRWFDVHISRIGGQGSKYLTLIYNDITSRKESEAAMNEALRQMENRTRELDAVINAVPDALVIFDNIGRINYLNNIAKNTLQLDSVDIRSDLVERNKRMNLYSADGTKLQLQDIPLYRVLKNGEFISDHCLKIFKQHKEEIYLSMSCAPIWDSDGKIAGAVATYRDITEKRRTELSLQQSETRALHLVEELEEANNNKNTSIAVLSHELRNPIASIMMSLSLINNMASSKEQAKRAMDVIERQSGQLAHLVDDLLDLTRITRNKIELKKEYIELNRLVDEIVSDFKSRFDEKNVMLEVKLSEAPIRLDVDPVRMTQIVENLMLNALKFTSTGDRATVSIGHDKQHQEAVITVQDTGIGIQPEMLPQLFEPFVQADNTLAHSDGGLGLGLAIIKEMVELHEGSVHVDSGGPGKGSKFTIRLPFPDADGNACPDSLNDNKGNPGRTRILLIDDNPDLVEIMDELLSCLGYEVLSAPDGPKGIEAARDFQPQIILCDIGLPGMNGYEVARKIRNDDALKETALIALSGYAQPEDLLRSKDAGFNRHLAKPVALETLKRALEEVS